VNVKTIHEQLTATLTPEELLSFRRHTGSDFPKIAPGNTFPQYPTVEYLRLHGRSIPANVVFHEMVEHRCHWNVAELWKQQVIDAVGTGWALSSEEMEWFQHSWGMRDGIIVETTIPFEHYWGVVMRGVHADRFAVAIDELNQKGATEHMIAITQENTSGNHSRIE